MDFTTTTHQWDLLHILHTHREISITFNSSQTNETTLSTHHSQLHSTQYTTTHSHSIHITYTHYTTTPNTISNISTQILVKLNGKNQWQNHTLSHNSQIASYPITNHITFFILHTITITTISSILHNTSILILPSHHTQPIHNTLTSIISLITTITILLLFYHSHSQLNTFLHTTIHTLLCQFIHSYSLPLINYPFHHSHINTHTILHTTSLHSLTPSNTFHSNHHHSTHHIPSSTSSLHPYYYQSSLYSLITTNTPFYSIYHYPIYYTHPL